MGPKCHHKGPYKREAEGDSGQRKRLCDITSSRSEGGGRDQEPRQPGALLQTPEPILPWSLCGHGALPPLVSAPERCFQTSDLQNYMRININMCCFINQQRARKRGLQRREKAEVGKAKRRRGQERRPGLVPGEGPGGSGSPSPGPRWLSWYTQKVTGPGPSPALGTVPSQGSLDR